MSHHSASFFKRYSKEIFWTASSVIPFATAALIAFLVVQPDAIDRQRMNADSPVISATNTSQIQQCENVEIRSLKENQC
jgi:hypothetical protein